ncbi:MAG: hypothetical protein ACK5CA_03795, partial [Cyanobacteriota bacterium]
MQTLFSPTFRRVLPTTVFERLQSLWTSLGDWGGAEQILWTEAEGSGVFFLLLTASYQALLQGEPVSPRHYAVTITFDSGAVANLLKPRPLPPRPTQEFPHLLQQLTLRL